MILVPGQPNRHRNRIMKSRQELLGVLDTIQLILVQGVLLVKYQETNTLLSHENESTTTNKDEYNINYNKSNQDRQNCADTQYRTSNQGVMRDSPQLSCVFFLCLPCSSAVTSGWTGLWARRPCGRLRLSFDGS